MFPFDEAVCEGEHLVSQKLSNRASFFRHLWSADTLGSSWPLRHTALAQPISDLQIK